MLGWRVQLLPCSPAHGQSLSVGIRKVAVLQLLLLPVVWVLSPLQGAILAHDAPLVPEGVKARLPRLFGYEVLRAGPCTVLGAGRRSLLLTAAPQTCLAAPGMVCGGKAASSTLLPTSPRLIPQLGATSSPPAGQPPLYHSYH